MASYGMHEAAATPEAPRRRIRGPEAPEEAPEAEPGPEEGGCSGESLFFIKTRAGLFMSINFENSPQFEALNLLRALMGLK